MDQVRFVLVEPSHPGNIGGVARAMKNMGFSRLYLVAPAKFPAEEATARAAGADDILRAATVVNHLDEALAGCTLVCGTTARDRSIEWPTMNPRGFSDQAIARVGSGELAVVFGRERSGLTNQELDRCHIRVAIPANLEFPSLNLACAVQIIAYELRCALPSQTTTVSGQTEDSPVGADDMERFYQHLQQVLIELEFLNPAHPKKLMRRLKRLFNRAAPVANEMNILRGILTAVQDQARRYTRP
jgi:tRNA (cytidine32/uridine32-2'-O)-methyltransferase